jgi:hypothetical protein
MSFCPVLEPVPAELVYNSKRRAFLMNHIYRCVVVAAALVFGVCCALLGPTHTLLAVDAGQASFQQLFGEQIKQVKSTCTPADDLALAKHMQARTEQVTEMLSAERRIALLEKKIAAPPVDAKVTNELVTLCIAKLNSPSKAAGYSLILDETMRRKIQLAIKPVNEVMSQGCVDLGMWYASLAKPEKNLIKLALLQRAEGYLVRAVAFNDYRRSA